MAFTGRYNGFKTSVKSILNYCNYYKIKRGGWPPPPPFSRSLQLFSSFAIVWERIRSCDRKNSVLKVKEREQSQGESIRTTPIWITVTLNIGDLNNTNVNHRGCLLLTKSFRKIRLESTWNMTLWVFPAENFQEQRNIWKASRVFSGRNRASFVWPWNENARTKQKQQTNGNRAIWLVYRTETNAPGFWLVKRTLEWKNFMPENFLEIIQYYALTSSCNTSGQSSSNAFSILGFSLTGKRRVHVLTFSSIGL